MITKKTSLSYVLQNLYIKKNEPISLVHFITNRCNARCSFCFIDFDSPNTFKGELTIDEIDKLTRKLGKSLLNVNLTGGEPFARKDISKIAKLYLDNSTVQSIYITTNASLPDRIKSFAEEISNYSPNTELSFQISIDDLPENHNRVRKIKNLFDDCLETYRILEKMNSNNINPVINITVSEENCKNIRNIYRYFKEDCKFKSIKACIVRDEGIYKIPNERKKEIFNAYDWLTDEILKDTKRKEIKNYNKDSIQGKLHRKKDEISWEIIKKTYLEPKYISPCHAGGLFGVIASDGKVFPCEILENKILGDLRENNMDFMDIWKKSNTLNIKKDIIDNKCNCSYECALTYNILGNWRYQPSLLSSILK